MTATGQDARPSDTAPQGLLLVRLAWIGTAVTCVTSLVNALTGDRDAYALSAAPALVMFSVGCVAFLWAFAVAVERSRTEAIGVGGLFFLAGCAPVRVQRSMLAALAVQATVPVAVAVVRPFTAFAVLAPMWTLGLAGLWGARHGTFPARVDDREAAAGERGATDPSDAPD
ncbi:MAG: hypothetical protein ACR2JF_10945 [Iamia sp.]